MTLVVSSTILASTPIPNPVSKMKTALLVLVMVLALDSAKSENMLAMDEMMQCGKEMGMTPEQVRDLLVKKGEDLGCLRACVMKQLGCMVDGKLHEDNILSFLEKHKDAMKNYARVQESTKKCIDDVTKGGDVPECELAQTFEECIHHHMGI
ncbi:hypothetical protein QAD02_020237 [Eretmocerus hayati]|uniref:Uncharacterized protein n=1 Tax=Eretmocerus hayati TaxID=131215 RepID=A0ACC2PLH5_9HYME|nr:hypothetical protein QAD02_020237 [Eretmocerus hayati]